MDTIRSALQQHFFKDDQGRIVIWQWPNAPLYGWMLVSIMSRLATSSDLQNGLSQLGTALLFTWAYLELAEGVNYFRKLLGLVFLVVIMADYLS